MSTEFISPADPAALSAAPDGSVGRGRRSTPAGASGLAHARAVLANRSQAAVFLCYHSISAEGPPFLSLPPELFERQMALLARLGYESGDSDKLRRLLAGERPARPLAFLTFDDGFADNHTEAMPIMRAHGMKPMIFVLPPRVGTAGPLDWPEVAERQRLHPRVMRSMDWQAADELAADGAEIGSHGLTHADLSRLGQEALRDELVSARRILADRYGRCDALAYPFGYWSPAVALAAADAGYTFAFSVPGDGQGYYGPHAIPRVPVDFRDGERRMRLKLSAAGRRLLLSPMLPAARRVRALVRR